MHGKELKGWREGMGWSQVQAAAALGMERRAYQELEASDRPLETRVEADARMLEWIRGTEFHRKPESHLKEFEIAGRAHIAKIDNMPKPGRPKKDPWLCQLERLYDVLEKNCGVLIHVQSLTDTGTTRRQLNEIVEAINTARAMRDSISSEG